jgi:hypothetical protein
MQPNYPKVDRLTPGMVFRYQPGKNWNPDVSYYIVAVKERWVELARVGVDSKEILEAQIRPLRRLVARQSELPLN